MLFRLTFFTLAVACLAATGQESLSPIADAADQRSQLPTATTDKQFPSVYNSEPSSENLLTPHDALAALQLPTGFSATLFASEPDVQNPIAVSVDALDRVWIAENYTYAERTARFDLTLNDRVIVLEDANHDGVAEKRTVFIDSIKMLTGIVTGQGGVWLMCPPQLLFVPDADGDLVPDGPPQVVLDGFHVARENYHNFANGLSWSPDGWLVGRCGASCPGELGLPGSGDEQRVPMRGGMWRYHPQRRVVEALTHGTTNPWGHDWNAVGDLFFINTVNGHLWHAVPGAHFVRSHTIDANPYVYELLDTHADHWHFDTGQGWQASRDGAASDFGGGHAHIGMMIYQAETWPIQYRDKLLTVNMHGRRINVERLEEVGGGYVGRHEDDFVSSEDTWFRGMDLAACSDGNVLLIDWSDTGECHDHTGVHRTSGRVFKLCYDPAQASTNQVTSQSPVVLAELQRSGNEWSARRARELTRSKHVAGVDCSAAIAVLQQGLIVGESTVERLRSLWGLKQLDALDETVLLSLLNDPDPHLRKWSIRLLLESLPLDHSDGSRPVEQGAVSPRVMSQLVAMASNESAALVRLELASNLQRLPHADRVAVARGLISHKNDAHDHNLPLMIWYGLTPLGDRAESELVGLLDDCQMPTIQRLIARRIVERLSEDIALNDQLVATAIASPTARGNIVLGMQEGLAGRRQVQMPQRWQELCDLFTDEEDQQLQPAIQQLSVLFGDGREIGALMVLAMDESQALSARSAALHSLVEARAPGLQATCVALLKTRYLNRVAVEGLVAESEPHVGAEMIKRFRTFAPLDRPRVLSILASRTSWAKKLLEAVAEGDIQRDEISPAQARQMANQGDPELAALLLEHWGQVRETPAERVELIARLRRELTEERLEAGNKAIGRLHFEKHCASCHTLFGVGGKLGPDLTGSQRSNIDYLLENIVDPSAVVTNDFRATIVVLIDGRVLTGLLTSQTESLLTLATPNETYRIPIDEVEQIQRSSVSTMPDGLLSTLTADEVRDLFAYLQSQQQMEK